MKLIAYRSSCLVVVCVLCGICRTSLVSSQHDRRVKRHQVQSILTETDSTITLRDARGKNVTVRKQPRRVLPLSTSYLDLWYECGGTAVGRPNADLTRLPRQSHPLPPIGHVTSPNMEKVFACTPDLVLINYGYTGHRRIIPLLEKVSTPYLVLTYENFNDYLQCAFLFSRLTGREDIANDSIPAVISRIDSIIAQIPKGKAPRVLILFGSVRDVVVKLPGSLVGSIVEDLNGNNVAYDATRTSDDMQVFSMERIVERDPEVILIQTMGDFDRVEKKLHVGITSNPTWKTITAVHNNRVHYLPTDRFLYKPNKRFVDSYRYCAQLLYPGIF